MNRHQHSQEYLKKKAFYQQVLTIYGRKPVVEALNNESLPCLRLHLAESNKPSTIIKDVIRLAKQRQIDIVYHDRQALARISKNGKQDQGICLDIHCPKHQNLASFLGASTQKKQRLLAIDRITNPQNLGMIIRSACAGNVDGIIIPKKGSAKLDALAIKASAGAIFKAPLLHCQSLETDLMLCKQHGASIVGLSSHSQQPLKSFNEGSFVVYVLGNESEGINKNIMNLCDDKVYIPMRNQIESLNVAVTASLIAFKNEL